MEEEANENGGRMGLVQTVLVRRGVGNSISIIWFPQLELPRRSIAIELQINVLVLSFGTHFGGQCL